MSIHPTAEVDPKATPTEGECGSVEVLEGAVHTGRPKSVTARFNVADEPDNAASEAEAHIEKGPQGTGAEEKETAPVN